MWRSWLARWWRPDAARPRPPARPDGALCRVVTWNIHHGADAWDHLDLDAVAAVLDACAADVVALQEVDRHWDERSDDVDQTAWLSERLGMHGIHGWTVRRVRRDRSADGRHGNALLSRQPWTGRQVTRFADVAGVERRGVVAGTTRTPLGPVRFVSAHLSTRHASLRSTEVGQLLTVVAKDRAAAVRTPVVVAGDFNAEPRNPELADLADTLTDACRGSRQGLGDTAPAAKPWRRTDHVWVGGLTAVGAAVLRTEASDHLPVVVDLATPDEPVG